MRTSNWSRPRLALLLGLALSCHTPAPRGASSDGDGALYSSALPANAPPRAADRFPHALHTGDNKRIRGYKNRGLECTDCHALESVLEGSHARPGANEHAPCDECHRDEFYKEPGAFCRNCHTSVSIREKGATGMQKYPARGFRQTLASRFSHKMHLDSGNMDKKVGFHIDCGDCHKRDASSRRPMLPGHKECSRCHGDKVKGKLALDQCAGCHPQRDVDLVRGRLFIKGDLIFAHRDHERDSKNKSIRCEVCHADIRRAGKREQASIPAMQRCAVCHEDATKTPARVRIGRCETCHQRIRSDQTPLSHLVQGKKELPESHTMHFRRNHGEQAAAADANCRFCHEGLSASTRDSCFQCHRRMPPRDHIIGWRDDGHGREASMDSDRCATCHSGDECVACHMIPPRSHQPMTQFRAGGHADPARFDMRACFACHTYETTCTECHEALR